MEEKNSNQESEVRSQTDLLDQADQVAAVPGEILAGQPDQVKPGAFISSAEQDEIGKAFEKRLNGVFPGEKLESVPVDMAIFDGGKTVFSADLVMTAIRNTPHGITFEVKNPEGFNMPGFDHLNMDRKSFPIDDDFNMSFMDAPFKEPKELVEKRNEFNKLRKMRLVILMEE